jgi:hypothetical protein
MSPKEFRLEVSSAVTNNIHRSTINRICLAARMEAGLKLPFGEVKESTLRTLRIKVPKNKCGAVLKHALKEKGSYSKITAKAIEVAARELGCLKTPSDNPTESKNQGEGVQAWLQEHSKHQNALPRLLKMLGTQPALIQEVAALVKHQRQQLNDLLTAIG